jgi:hypothetical protein
VARSVQSAERNKAYDLTSMEPRHEGIIAERCMIVKTKPTISNLTPMSRSGKLSPFQERPPLPIVLVRAANKRAFHQAGALVSCCVVRRQLEFGLVFKGAEVTRAWGFRRVATAESADRRSGN